MKTNNSRMTDAQRRELDEQVMPGGRCTNPEVQKWLYSYISGTLENPETEEADDGLLESSKTAQVEEHLLECRHCREFFLIMDGVGDEARSSRELRSDEDSLTRGGARAPTPDGTPKDSP